MILRELLVKLGLDVDAQSFAKGELAAELIKSSFEKAVDVVKELGSEFLEVIQKTAEAGHQLEELAQRTGTEVGELQNLSAAAGASGVDMESLAGSLGILARNMYAAKTGSDESQKAFSRLGIKTKNANGTLRSTSDVMLDLADHFSTIPDSAEKTAQAMSVLGRQGASMIPMLNKGRAGIAAIANETFSMTEEQIKAGSELIHTQKQIAAQTAALWQRAIAPLLPAINDLLKRWLAWKKANAAVMAAKIEKYLKFLIDAIGGLADGLEFVRKNMDAVKMVAKDLAIAFAILNAAAVLAAVKAAAAWMIAAAPFVLIAGLVAGILLVMDDIRGWKAGEKSAFGEFADVIADWLKPNANDPWWLKGIKELVEYMARALGLAERLGIIGRPNHDEKSLINAAPGHMISNAVAGSNDYLQVSANRAERGQVRFRQNWTGGTSEDEVTDPYEQRKAAMEYQQYRKEHDPSYSPQFRVPEYRSQTGGAAGSGVLAGSNINAPATFNIYPSAGESITEATARQIDDYWQSSLEEAAAGVSR